MLIVTIGAMFIIATLSIAVLSITANTLYQNNQQQLRSMAFNIAESGAEVGVYWLQCQSSPPTYTLEWDPFGGQQSLGNGTYQVVIYPDANNVTNYLKSYRIVSVGTIGTISKKIEVVMKQATFGKYAYFTDKETSSVSGGAIWWKAGEVIDGPVHSNNTGGSNFNINYNGSTAPIFLDMVTGSGSTISYTPSRPTTETNFKKIFAEGSKGFKLGVPKIDLPESTSVQKNAAWGSAAGFPSATGVYLKPDSGGGIYIVGDAKIDLSLDGCGNQLIAVTQGTNVTTINVNKSTGCHTATGPLGIGSPASSANPLNGVIFCTGSITSLKGELADNSVVNGTIQRRSAMTISTDVNNGKDITITGNITYHTKPDKTQDSDAACNLAAGTFGLVSDDIKIASSAPANLEIDAVCMAGGKNTTAGSFYVQNYDSKKPTGTLTVLGGIIQKARGPVGTFDSSTGQTQTGYSKNYHYDPRLATNPPPFYPTTGRYERYSWRMVPD
jgi:hypothetical protein